MIAAAEAQRSTHPLKEKIRFAVDAAEKLETVADATVNVALCVGALEHMPDKTAVLAQIERVLVPGGVFICLTLNGDYFWYTTLSRLLSLTTRHLSSDQRVNRDEFAALSSHAGLRVDRAGFWTFIPRGDMPRIWADLLVLLDWVGGAAHIDRLRGGLYMRALKPAMT